MLILVVAEHDDQSLKSATLNTVTAAAALRADEVHVLVAGSGCPAAAAAAAKLAGVAKVKVADAAHYADHGVENLSALIVANARGYSHLLAPATSFGKNLMPRVARRSTAHRSRRSSRSNRPIRSCGPSMPATRWPR